LAARGKPSARECSATYWGEEKAPRLASILAESRPEDAPANPYDGTIEINVLAAKPGSAAQKRHILSPSRWSIHVLNFIPSGVVEAQS
jgi:hypothetical protein